MSCRVTYTVEAKATADAMTPERRALLERGLSKLAQDPYHKASTHVGTHEDDRRAQVAPGLLVEYVVAHGLLVVVLIDVFDEALIMDG
ncbi:hypothetical protein ACFP1Z_25480 [Streptomyces gamaensis]|uniref:Addiction module toxin RelE n=1 Tax=Streptomyces gamaensis TaxID=1763542 RepID=A0ABW0ZAB1_9ACTN